MSSNVDNFAVAVDILNRKIAELNIEIALNNKDLEEELNKYLNLRKEIYDGNTSLINKIIDGEIK